MYVHVEVRSLIHTFAHEGCMCILSLCALFTFCMIVLCEILHLVMIIHTCTCMHVWGWLKQRPRKGPVCQYYNILCMLESFIVIRSIICYACIQI